MSGRGDRLAAVLFDMDGTLLDSERLWDSALRALARRHGGELSEPARRAMIGRNGAESMAVFYADLEVPDPDPASDNQFVIERMVELMATVTWRPGAAELVSEVRRAGVPAALVTSTGRRLVEVALDAVLGRDTFDAVVCGCDVTAPKPHPESYRTAADLLNVEISRCVAIEDSPTGVASALAAGAVVVGVPGELDLSALTGIHLVPNLTSVDLAHLTGLVDAVGGYFAAK